MFCNKCGKQVTDGSPFCMFCGNDFSKVRVVRAPSERQIQQTGYPISRTTNRDGFSEYSNQNKRGLQARICPGCGAPIAPDTYSCEYCGTMFERNEPQIIQQQNQPLPMQPVQVTQFIQQPNPGLTWGMAAKLAVTNAAVQAGTGIATEITKGVIKGAIRGMLPW